MLTFAQRLNRDFKGICCRICCKTALASIQFYTVCHQFQTAAQFIRNYCIRNIRICIQRDCESKGSCLFIIGTGTLIGSQFTAICQFHSYLCFTTEINRKFFICLHIASVKLCPYSDPSFCCRRTIDFLIEANLN